MTKRAIPEVESTGLALFATLAPLPLPSVKGRWLAAAVGGLIVVALLVTFMETNRINRRERQ